MAETCAWRDCRSSEVQPHMETRQCLSCGRHTNMQGQPVEFKIIPERREWVVAEEGR